jgi:serine/threonine-protein kinase HipA
MSRDLLNPVERLLYSGNRGLGALEYEIKKDLPEIGNQLDLNRLSTTADQIIKKEYPAGSDIASLNSLLVLASTAGGAQAKVLVSIAADDRCFANGENVSERTDSYLLKLDHDTEHSWSNQKNKVEYVYNQMARDAGINVAESRLISEDRRTHFASKRFDIEDGQKLHSQTVNALTGFFGRNNEYAYIDIFRILAHFELPYSTFEEFYRRMVFNVVASNRDDHTRNTSFIMSQSGVWSLAPAYDLTFPYDPYQNLVIPHQMAINGKTKEINRQDLAQVGRLAGIMNYNKIIDQILDVVSSFDSRARKFELDSETVKLILKDLELNRIRIQKG